jgi:hypothetical protein
MCGRCRWRSASRRTVEEGRRKQPANASEGGEEKSANALKTETRKKKGDCEEASGTLIAGKRKVDGNIWLDEEEVQRSKLALTRQRDEEQDRDSESCYLLRRVRGELSI